MHDRKRYLIDNAMSAFRGIGAMGLMAVTIHLIIWNLSWRITGLILAIFFTIMVLFSISNFVKSFWTEFSRIKKEINQKHPGADEVYYRFLLLGALIGLLKEFLYVYLITYLYNALYPEGLIF